MQKIDKNLVENLKIALVTIIQETQDKLEHATSAIITEGYWNIGKTLQASPLTESHSLRDLAPLLEIERSVLTRALQFFQTWPEACPTELYPTLRWSHFKELMKIKEPNERLRLVALATNESWPTRELRTEVDKSITTHTANTNKTNTNTMLTIRRPDGYSHYAFLATLDRIIDGDTLLITIDLGFHTKREERIRLSNINAPEKGTPAGEAATQFLNSMLAPNAQLAIRTHSTDMYGRYVADVFFAHDQTMKSEDLFLHGDYLSQVIVDNGHANTI